MVNEAIIKRILDFELKPDKLGENFEEINEHAIKLFQKLFVENLNFDLVRGQFGEIGEPISTDDWSRDAEAEKVFIIAEKEEFRIIYIVVKNLTITRERQSIASLKRKRWAKKGEYICIFFAENSLIWDMVCPHFSEGKMILRRYILGDGENHRTVSDNLIRMDASDPQPLFERVQQAFKVQVVTKAFFEDYKKAFFILKNELADQGIPKKEAHEFTLQLLNRIMFIYFISKKENWLNTKNFIGWLWTEYKKRKKYGSDDFYEIWLRQIFFKAFNNKVNEIIDLPKDVIDEILSFPYLNGGLFTQNELDNLKININDDLFTKIFNFFENYNFTIREDSPIDEEVAVDPQMIGYVYESLANVAEEIYDRTDMGIFYTPRIEVDFMVKRALIEYFSKKIKVVNKNDFYLLLFSTLEKRNQILKKFKENFWYEFEAALENLSVVDPACGSGAFLVGMLNVLSELYELVYSQIKIKRNLTDFELKKRIIQYSLYGVDVMPWAIRAAELRLWLQLIVETELDKTEIRRSPLLPNFDLNLRIGDSLVQEIGNFFFNLRKSNLNPKLIKELENLKIEKRKYYDNPNKAKFKSPVDIKEEEIRLFEKIVDYNIETLNKEIEEIKKIIIQEKGQKDLLNQHVFDQDKIDTLKVNINNVKTQITKLHKLKEILEIPGKKPFIWEIDFAEIFGDKNGFDIVIGNPPYVRQELISPPNRLKSEVTSKDKEKYKEKLELSVLNQFPFINKVDKKSDLYIYFYFHGLSLLNPQGSFCFITSNSWLSAGYGKLLQEFLLKYVPIIAIYDSPKRSFEHADINTIIALLNAPKFKRGKHGLNYLMKDVYTSLNNAAKFILFKKPFKEIISPDILIEIENIEANFNGSKLIDFIKNLNNTDIYHVFTLNQEDLLENAWKYPKSYKKKEKFKKGTYKGNMWGPLFFRMPDIIYEIMRRREDAFIKLSNQVKFEYGNKTGLVDFFIIPKTKKRELGIEDLFLKEIVTSTHEIESYFILSKNIKNYCFVCNKNKAQLKKEGYNGALNYIKWGESQKTKKKGSHTISNISWNKVASVKNNKPEWYSLKLKKTGAFIVPLLIREKFFFAINKEKFLDSNMFFHGIFNEEKIKEIGYGILNCTLTYLFLEIFGRHNIPGRFNLYGLELENVLVPNFISFDPKNMSEIGKASKELAKRNIEKIFTEIGLDSSKEIRKQMPNPLKDRLILDNIVFNELNLKADEKNEIYFVLGELIKNRLEKEKTVEIL